MTSGPRPAPSILRLIRGEKRPARLKNDRPKIGGRPSVPPGAVLDEDELLMWNWLMEHVYLPSVHGTADGAAFVKIARLWVRVNQCDEKISQLGLVICNPRTSKAELQPYARLSRDLWQQLSSAFAEVGAS